MLVSGDRQPSWKRDNAACGGDLKPYTQIEISPSPRRSFGDDGGRKGRPSALPQWGGAPRRQNELSQDGWRAGSTETGALVAAGRAIRTTARPNATKERLAPET